LAVMYFVTDDGENIAAYYKFSNLETAENFTQDLIVRLTEKHKNVVGRIYEIVREIDGRTLSGKAKG